MNFRRFFVYAVLPVFLCLLTRCGGPVWTPELTPVDTQSLKPELWSKDGKTLYLTYIVEAWANPKAKYRFIKVDLDSGNFDVLYDKSELPYPRFISGNHEEDQFLFYVSGGLGVHQWKSGELRTLAANLSFSSAHQAYRIDDYVMAPMSVPRLNPDGNTFFYDLGWACYSLKTQSAISLRQDSGSMDYFWYVNPFQNKIYLSNVFPSGTQKNTVAEHAWGVFDVETAVISDRQTLPQYDGFLSFWDWISEDEILFSQIDEEGKHLNAVSYYLSGQTYEVREGFRQKGLLSNDKTQVAYVRNGSLMVSHTNGSVHKKILSIPLALPH